MHQLILDASSTRSAPATYDKPIWGQERRRIDRKGFQLVCCVLRAHFASAELYAK
jgi:hypothetical protein